jgi:hypothetical protein
MNGRRGPGPGQIIAGIFLILFGLCGTLLGGGCTVLMFSVVFQQPYGEGIPLLLVALAILAGGLASIWAGIMLMTGRLG